MVAQAAIQTYTAAIGSFTDKSYAWSTLEPEERAATLAVLAARDRSDALDEMSFEDQEMTIAVQDIVTKFVRMAPEIRAQQLEALDEIDRTRMLKGLSPQQKSR